MKKKIVAGVVLLAVAGGAFYGGMQFEKSSAPTQMQRGGQFMTGANGPRGMRGATNGGITAGEILSKDATGFTVKMQDGSSKIILVAESTQISKSAEGSSDDLAVGTTVMVSGSANGDGSISAQSVQIRPAGAMPFGGTAPVR